MPTAVHEGQNAASGSRQPLADTNAKTIAPGNTIEVSFDHADVMACGAPRPQAHPGKPRRAVRHADRHIRDEPGAAAARAPAATTNSVYLPRHSGIPALYGRRVLERHARQARKDLRPTRMGAAEGLTGAGPPWSRPAGRKRIPDFKLKLVPTFPSSPQPETVSQNQRSKRDVVSDRALNRKAHPRISTQNGTHFPKPLQQRLGPSRFPKAGDRKVVAHQQRALNQHAVSRE